MPQIVANEEVRPRAVGVNRFGRRYDQLSTADGRSARVGVRAAEVQRAAARHGKRQRARSVGERAAESGRVGLIDCKRGRRRLLLVTMPAAPLKLGTVML